MFADRIDSDRLLWISAGIASTGAIMFWLVTSGSTGLFALALLGIGLGPVFPTLIAATKIKVGEQHVQNAIGFQVAAAALGGGLMPAGVGLLVSATGLEVVAVFPEKSDCPFQIETGPDITHSLEPYTGNFQAGI